MTHIILEGVDRVGKTTVADEIERLLGPRLRIKLSKPTPQQLEAVARQQGLTSRVKIAKAAMTAVYTDFFALLTASPVPLIVDRAHVSEFVYAPLYRGYSAEYVFRLEAAVKRAKISPSVVLLVADCDLLVDDGKSHDPTAFSDEQDRFLEALEYSHCPKKIVVSVHRDGERRPVEEIAQEILAKV